MVGGGVVEGGEEGEDVGVLGEGLDGEGALAWGREEGVDGDGGDVEGWGDGEGKAAEAGLGEDDGVEGGGVEEFLDACSDVAAEGLRLEVGADGFDLGLAAGAAGADGGVFGDVEQRIGGGEGRFGDEDVVGWGAWWGSGDGEGWVRGGDGKVFKAMDDDVSLIFEESGFEGACEPAFFKGGRLEGIGEGLEAVAVSGEGANGEGEVGVEGLEGIEDEFSLS
jgi:hypothetical protein